MTDIQDVISRNWQMPLQTLFSRQWTAYCVQVAISAQIN